jgi:excisionase family DNA binding protein
MRSSRTCEIFAQPIESILRKTPSLPEPPQSDKEYLTVDEVLTLLPFSKGTLYQYTSRGQIPYLKLGKHLMFKHEDIRLWLETHRQV